MTSAISRSTDSRCRLAQLRLSSERGEFGCTFAFKRIVDALVPADATDSERLRLAIVFEVGASAILAAEGLHVADDDMLQAAREAVRRMTAPNLDSAKAFN